MTGKRVLAALALCALACFVIAVFADSAFAQGKAGADKELANKRGLQILDSKGKTKKGPSRLQMAVGFGSTVVMIAVLKWL